MKKMNDIKKLIGKGYGEYVKQFTPRPKYIGNGLKAFITGGLICCSAMWFQNYLMSKGVGEEDAGIFTTIGLIGAAQLLTGIGLFDTAAMNVGAGVIVPITGFANSMVATAIEYKKEGPVLGVGGNMFKVAGPVLVCGYSAAILVGMIYWLKGILGW